MQKPLHVKAISRVFHQARQGPLPQLAQHMLREAHFQQMVLHGLHLVVFPQEWEVGQEQ